MQQPKANGVTTDKTVSVVTRVRMPRDTYARICNRARREGLAPGTWMRLKLDGASRRKKK